jgi:hypothetical protein
MGLQPIARLDGSKLVRKPHAPVWRPKSYRVSSRQRVCVRCGPACGQWLGHARNRGGATSVQISIAVVNLAPSFPCIDGWSLLSHG